LTTHPAAPVAPRTRSGVLGVSRGGETKGSRSRARFPARFSVKMRHPARPGQKALPPGANGPEPAPAGLGYGLKPPKPQPVARLSWPDAKPAETTTTRRFR
jgi:hypothetical protein